MHCLRLIVGLGFLCIVACASSPIQQQNKVFFDLQTKSSGHVSLFAKDLISTQHNERDLAISPDGQQILFTRVSAKNRFSAIMLIEKTSDVWSGAEIAHFSGKYSDLEPAFSPDGKRLYFASNRPLDGNGEPKDFDIWYVEKESSSWSEAKNLGKPVNSELNEFYPSISNSGNLYFTGLYDQKESGENIYKSSLLNGMYQKPVAVNEPGSAIANEFNAYVSPDESYLIFSSDRKKQRGDYADLYISFNQNGQWSEAINLGEKINTSQLDYCPFVYERNGARTLFFTRTDNAIENHYPNGLSTQEFIQVLSAVENGSGNIYSIDFDRLIALLQSANVQ